MKALTLAAVTLLAGCVTFSEVEIGAKAVLALCSAAPAIALIANPSTDVRNRLQAIADKCTAANQALSGTLTDTIANLVSPQAVQDQANDVAVVKAAVAP